MRIIAKAHEQAMNEEYHIRFDTVRPDEFQIHSIDRLYCDQLWWTAVLQSSAGHRKDAGYTAGTGGAV